MTPSTIPAFLRSMSALVRQLVTQGKALHVTAETADELDLLAGLPWDKVSIRRCPACDGNGHLGERLCHRCAGQVVQGVAPADIAWAWLKLSRVTPECSVTGGAPWEDGDHTVYGTTILRAAECAELAVGASELLSWSTDRRDGTRDGARAAWGFVVESLQSHLRLRIAELDSRTFHGQAPIPLNDSRVAICDRYRRELEAM